MKKVKFFIFILLLFLFHKNIYCEVVRNIAYLKSENIEKSSNEVITYRLNSKIKFVEHGENKKEQYLDEKNKIYVIGELDLTQTGKEIIYFKKNMYSSFYSENIRFFIQEGESEYVELEKESIKSNRTKDIELDGGKKYKVISVGENIKNTPNIESGNFSLEAFNKEKSIGEIINKLIIENKLTFIADKDNEETQYLDFKNQIKTIADISFINLLKEKAIFKMILGKDMMVETFVGTMGEEKFLFHWNNIDKCFYSDEVEIYGDTILDVLGTGIKKNENIESEDFTLSMLVGDMSYGSIKNKIVMESQNKILLEKKSVQKIARVGDIVKYELTVKTTRDEMFRKIILKDTLPKGFELLEKSIKVSKGDIGEIKYFEKNMFSLDIDFLSEKFTEKELSIEYMIRVNVNTKLGKNINRAIAYADNEINRVIESNLASAEIEIDGENFSEKGIIIGRVFIDIDEDKRYDSKKDISIPGVKVFLENGDFAITDSDGKYSIYGEDATTHIAKVDRGSVPLKLRGVKLTNRHSENGESQFIDLKKSQLNKGNFAYIILGDKDKTISIIQERKKILEERVNEIFYQVDSKELNFKQISKPERKELGENGIIDNHEIVDFVKGSVNIENKEKLEKNKENVEIDLRKKMKILNTDELSEKIENLNNELDIINIQNGDVVLNHMTFQIKSPSGGRIELFINDKMVGVEHIGIRATSAINSLFFLEYAAVMLETGKNKVRASYYDQFGVERNRIEKVVLVRGELERIVFEIKKSESTNEVVKFILKGTDSNGIEIEHDLNARVVLMDKDKGEWINGENGKNAEEIRVKIPKDSYKEVLFRPKPGKKKVAFKVAVEGLEEEFVFEIKGEAIPTFVNGIIEGRVNFKGKNEENFFFEKDISNIFNDKLYYRGAVFATGNLMEDYFLTLTYDSAKEKEKFFSYKDPEDYYPIYGDNSIKGHTGESREDLYIKIEKDKSYVMYGDLKTSELFDNRTRLNQYSRALTGFSSELSKEKININTFYAKANSTKVVDELQGRGVSGPYTLSNRDIIDGSEEIKLVTYNRGTKIVISELSMANGQDYTIDYDLGRIYFTEPIMGMDLEFNPVFIRVNYEVEEQSGDAKPVYGVVGRYNINKNVYLGGSYVKDDDKLEKYEMQGVALLYENEDHLAILEVSKTDDFEEGIGEAKSFYYKYEKDKSKIKVIYEKSDDSYYNPDADVQSGIDGLEIEGEYRLKNNNLLKFKSEFLKENLEAGSYEKKDVYLGVEFEKKSNFVYEVGAKHYFKSDTLDQGEINTIGAKIAWEPVEYPGFTTFLEYEQDVLLSDKKRVAAGIDYEVNDGTTLYFRQELISELSDEYYLDPEDDSNRTLVGVKTKKYLGSEVFTEYREVNEDEGVKPEVGTGLKREFEITENLSLYGTFERTDPVSYTKTEGDEKRKAENSVTFGYDYLIDDTSKTRGDFEFEFGETSSFLNKMGYGKKINESLSFIGKNRYYTEGDLEQEDRLILGLAYRDAENDRYNSLNKYELNYSKNIIDDNYKQLTNLVRSSHNYQFNRCVDGTLTLAIKNVETTYEEISSDYTAYLIAGTLSYDVYKNWTTGISLASTFDNKQNIDYGVGVEVGYVFESNLWLSLGYNFVGFKDKDFDPSGELNQGVFVRFRMNVGDVFDSMKMKKVN